MKISKNLIFYWIHKRWSHSVSSSSNILEKAYVNRPMYWSSAQEMHGHLVVVDPERMNQINRRYPDTIFLCFGTDDESICINDNEWILVPDESRHEKVFNHLLTIFDKFNKWGELLEHASKEVLSYEAIIRSCESVMQDPIALLDSSLKYVAYSKRLAVERGLKMRYIDEFDRMPIEYINMHAALGDIKLWESKEGVWVWSGDDPMLNRNIFIDGKSVGRLGIPYSKDAILNDYNSDIIDLVGDEIEQLYIKLGTFFRRPDDNTHFRYLISNILEGQNITREALLEQLEQMNYEIYDEYTLVQIRPHTEEVMGSYVAMLQPHLEGLVPQGTCFSVDNKCFLLINNSKHIKDANLRLANDLSMFLREGYMLAGASSKFNDLFELPLAAKQTDIAIKYGRKANPMHWYLEYDNYAFEYLLDCMCDELPARKVCAKALRTIVEYDNKNATHLYETLWTFIECKFNAAYASKALFLSRSTFLRRIERIKKITGLLLDSADEWLYIALSYKIFERKSELVNTKTEESSF